MSGPSLLVKKFEAPLGAEISGIDLAGPLEANAIKAIKDAIHENLVVVFRNQNLTHRDFVRFAACLGELATSTISPYSLKENPIINVISNILDDEGRNIGLPDAGEYWHTDGAYFETPHAYTLLYGLEIPRDGNGQPLGATQFVSTANAYDELSDEMKRRLEGLTAHHTLEGRYANGRAKRKPLTEEEKARNKDHLHPVIRTHAVTGRKCIYVNETYTDYIVGMPHDEGRALIGKLCRYVIEPRFYYSHQWRPNDVLIWDNCSTQHLATHDYALPQRRLVYRLVIKGPASPAPEHGHSAKT